jgi:mono/diheme cytochrome c family protein
LRNNTSFSKSIQISRNQIIVFIFIALLISGCENNMRNQPRYKPLAASEFFENGQSARPLIAGAIPQNQPLEDEFFSTGKSPDGQTLDAFPFPVTSEVLKRGQERYNIFCSPCHGFDGYGQGMIVERGFSAPPSFHTDRLRSAPAGHFFDVITNGFGQMYSYSYRIPPEDRWAIVAYIRALQYSQNASTQDIPANELQKLQSSGN